MYSAFVSLANEWDICTCKGMIINELG